MKSSEEKFQWQREFKHYHHHINSSFQLSGQFSAKLDDWLASDEDRQKLAAWLNEQPTILLAHADDGVIWGKVANGSLIISHSVLPDLLPELRAETLQQCRLFNPRGEWLIWRDGASFGTRLITDEEVEEGIEAFDEHQMLWGTYRDDKHSRDGFTVVYEGQGLLHAPPIDVPKECFGTEPDERKLHRPLRLTVRHYLEDDSDGFARITVSRLVKLWIDC
jgi:CRISPR-associated protein (TIGR03984 family)